jgi:SAM-dependent methyltransferase
MIDALRESVLRRPRLLRLAQFAVTGERVPRRLPLLAKAIVTGPHDFVVDLGCGAAPLLDFIDPARYVGIESSKTAIEEARRRHGGEGREFVAADLRDLSVERWRGADVAVVSSVAHHLDDPSVVALAARIRDELRPGRLLFQDAEPTGPLGPLVRAAGDGRFLRPQARLLELLRADFAVTVVWTYVNPVRSFRQFLLELEPLD